MSVLAHFMNDGGRVMVRCRSASIRPQEVNVQSGFIEFIDNTGAAVIVHRSPALDAALTGAWGTTSLMAAE